jgi:hypothetical protein
MEFQDLEEELANLQSRNPFVSQVSSHELVMKALKGEVAMVAIPS